MLCASLPGLTPRATLFRRFAADIMLFASLRLRVFASSREIFPTYALIESEGQVHQLAFTLNLQGDGTSSSHSIQSLAKTIK